MGSFIDKYRISWLLVLLISLSFASHSHGMKANSGSEQLHYPEQDTAGKVRIRGVITDSNTGEQMPFATVVVTSGDTLVTATTTNIDGQYSLSFVPARGRKYVFKVMYLGYDTVQTNLIVVNKPKPRK